MSPEQAEMTSHDIDTRCDIYSLGVLLYELLTGSTPTDTATLRRAGIDEIRRIIRVWFCGVGGVFFAGKTIRLVGVTQVVKGRAPNAGATMARYAKGLLQSASRPSSRPAIKACSAW